MNNKGFTLVETIMVVAIIALLALVFTPNVTSLINKNNTNTYNSTLLTIKNAAKSYISNHRYDSTFIKNVTCGKRINIKLKTLVDSGELSKIPENPCKDNSSLKFENDDKVVATFDCVSKDFTYSFREEIDENTCKNRG